MAIWLERDLPHVQVAAVDRTPPRFSFPQALLVWGETWAPWNSLPRGPRGEAAPAQKGAGERLSISPASERTRHRVWRGLAVLHHLVLHVCLDKPPLPSVEGTTNHFSFSSRLPP